MSSRSWSLSLLAVVALCGCDKVDKVMERGRELQAELLGPQEEEDPIEAAISAYETVAGLGDAKSTCARAGLVAEAAEAAGENNLAEQWRDTQKRDCEKAGLPAI